MPPFMRQTPPIHSQALFFRHWLVLVISAHLFSVSSGLHALVPQMNSPFAFVKQYISFLLPSLWHTIPSSSKYGAPRLQCSSGSPNVSHTTGFIAQKVKLSSKPSLRLSDLKHWHTAVL